ncbi:MAG TPA: tryptophan 2,3-dioxygenase family protein [Ferruginibacter sp.]|nr:tryptophan 2,3-dioxygenase family protein [Ferruginibacter sp.]HMP21162.1 tryptophan 2,3-dioxygenase family protein [Ferruginibacter sp.]
MEKPAMHYSSYLQLDTLLNTQHPESFKPGQQPAHDEMLFIIIHQAYELWFKQIIFEIDSASSILSKPVLNDNAADLKQVVHQLQRVTVILRLLAQQMDVMETMEPMDFLDFRNKLRPASGFQSLQFKLMEAKLGLPLEQRFGSHYYTSQLTTEEIQLLHNTEKAPTLLQLVNRWLERMPFLDEAKYWQHWEEPKQEAGTAGSFWEVYKQAYRSNLLPEEKQNEKFFELVFDATGHDNNRQLSAKACRSALFIMLYRGYPALELPWQLLDTLLQIDNGLGYWRYRHINMVQRTIGTRIGTGGSTGTTYLKGAMDSHSIFKEIAQLGSFLTDRNTLPPLPQALVEKLGYHF